MQKREIAVRVSRRSLFIGMGIVGGLGRLMARNDLHDPVDLASLHGRRDLGLDGYPGVLMLLGDGVLDAERHAGGKRLAETPAVGGVWLKQRFKELAVHAIDDVFALVWMVRADK